MNRRFLLRIVAFCLGSLCCGCSRAPSIAIVGSFFPVWMICLTIGVSAALATRVVLLRNKLETFVQPLWLFYPCAVILTACLIWIVFYR